MSDTRSINAKITKKTRSVEVELTPVTVTLTMPPELLPVLAHFLTGADTQRISCLDSNEIQRLPEIRSFGLEILEALKDIRKQYKTPKRK